MRLSEPLHFVAIPCDSNRWRLKSLKKNKYNLATSFYFKYFYFLKQDKISKVLYRSESRVCSSIMCCVVLGYLHWLIFQRITTRDPADENNPFYRADGGPMKPLAKLVIRKLREYRKSCSDTSTSDFADIVSHAGQQCVV